MLWKGGKISGECRLNLWLVRLFQSDPVTLDGWCVWQIPEITDLPLDGTSDITIGMHVTCQAKGWGTIDDFYLFKQ